MFLSVAHTACHAGDVRQAEILPTPLPGVVLSANIQHGKCGADGCTFTYRLRITNPMDRDVNVQECRLVDGSLRLPLTTIAGVGFRAHATKTVSATYVLPVDKDAASGLVDQRVTCTGLDWHGNPPI